LSGRVGKVRVKAQSHLGIITEETKDLVAHSARKAAPANLTRLGFDMLANLAGYLVIMLDR